jgi:hypothetical protein
LAETALLAAVLLPGNCLSTHYAHDHPPSLMAIPRGRISFEPPAGLGGKGGAAPFASVLFLYGVVTEAEVKCLKKKGIQVWRYDGAT